MSCNNRKQQRSKTLQNRNATSQKQYKIAGNVVVAGENIVKCRVFNKQATKKPLRKVMKSWVKPYWECREVADENLVKYSVFNSKAANTLGKVVKSWVKHVQPQGKWRSHG